jgi:hypothetical protein
MTACLQWSSVRTQMAAHPKTISHFGMASPDALASRKAELAVSIPRSGLFRPSIALWLHRRLFVTES